MLATSRRRSSDVMDCGSRLDSTAALRRNHSPQAMDAGCVVSDHSSRRVFRHFADLDTTGFAVVIHGWHTGVDASDGVSRIVEYYYPIAPDVHTFRIRRKCRSLYIKRRGLDQEQAREQELPREVR